MIQQPYRARTITGRLAIHFGVSKRRIREWLLAGTALLVFCGLAIVLLTR